MELVQQLKTDGIEKGLCRMWQMKLKPGIGIEALVELFVRGIDFCVKKDYPTLDFMRKNFKGKCEPYGAYVDDEVIERNREDVVLNGDSKAMLDYDGYTVANVFVRHGSQAAITAADYAVVTVDVFDDAKVFVGTAGNAQVLISVYGNATVEKANDCKGVSIVYKRKNTY